jgi:MFS transporter, ACS family, hexuronate transporter
MTGSPAPNDTVRAWGVCGLLLLATMLNYMDRQALAVTLPTLKAQYQLAEGRVGVLEGCFGFAFAFGSLLFGWLADRFGPRFLYPTVLAGWSLAGVATSCAGQPWVSDLFGTADDPGTGVYYWLLGCRILLGIYEAGHWPCALLTVRALLSARNRTLGNGILQSGASIGAIVTPLYIEATERAGQSWEFPFWSIGLTGLVWVPLWFIGVFQADLSYRSPETTSRTASEPTGFWRRLIVLAVIVGTLTISWQFLRAWLGLFLQDHHGYTKTATRGLMAGYFVASDVGCILSGVLVATLASRGWVVHAARRLGFLVFTLLTGCGAVIPFVGDGWLMVGLLFLTGAGILGLHPYYYSLTQEISGKHMGVLSGGLAASGWVVSSVSQILLGKQIEATKSYQLGLVIVGLAPLVGLLVLVLFWPKSPTSRSA